MVCDGETVVATGFSLEEVQEAQEGGQWIVQEQKSALMLFIGSSGQAVGGSFFLSLFFRFLSVFASLCDSNL